MRSRDREGHHGLRTRKDAVKTMAGATKIPPPKQRHGANSNQEPPEAQEAKPEHRLSGRNIVDFLDLPIDPKTNFLGNRFLTMGSGMFLIAPSGHGKSSFSIQLLISFSIGRPAFGIKPPRPLRILCIQSEDDDAETKKFAQVIRKMNLSERELELLKENTRFQYRNDLTGDDFLKALESFCSEWPPELIIINSFTGFLLADLKDEEKVARFLRAKLNPILTKFGCAAIIVHTPKTNFTRLENMQWYDWMYAMSGCASLTTGHALSWS
jgi:RecA-family ATPase